MALGAAPAIAAGEFDRQKAVRRVEQLIRTSYPEVPITTVACPKRPKPPSGVALRCVAAIETAGLTVDAIKVRGRYYRLEASQAVVARAAVEQLAATGASLPATATCGTGTWLVVAPGATIACQTTLSDGVVRQVEVTVRDVAGNAVVSKVS